MNEKLEDLVESVESTQQDVDFAEIIEMSKREDQSKKIILVGTHQGASLVMANLMANIKTATMEAVAKFAVRPQRSYPQRPKKGRKRFN